MSVINVVRTVAEAPVGSDMIAANVMERVAYDRVLTGVALVGSAVAGDTEVDVVVGLQVVFTATNGSLSRGILRGDVLSTRVRIPAGQKVSVRVVRPPVTHPVRIYLHFLP